MSTGMQAIGYWRTEPDNKPYSRVFPVGGGGGVHYVLTSFS
jgi:hypothetical protein